MDRISQLPDFIIHRILSFFDSCPPTDLVRMSVLSKTWFHLTASFPILDFCNIDFETSQSFFKYVEYATSRFCHQNVTAHRLVLDTFIYGPEELDTVSRCLELVLEKGVRELVIDFPHNPDLPNYILPNILLYVSVLESLSISQCDLPSSLMLHALKFRFLARLTLIDVPIDDEVIKYLTTSCPLLLVFHIRYCHGFKCFCVHGHQNLQDVRIDCDSLVERIDIEAPSLSSLFIEYRNGRGQLRMNVASCKKLTSVSYKGYFLPNSNCFADLSSNFPVIEYLNLDTKSKCINLKLSSHSLRTLVLQSEFDLEGIELSTPNLGLFIYSCNHWNPWYKVKHLPHLKACMLCYPHGSIDSLWFQKLRFFLDKKNGFKALNLHIHTDQKFTVLEKPKTIELSPYELEHVELHFHHVKRQFEHEEPSDHAAFVDAVLWCFRPRSLTLRSSHSPYLSVESCFPIIDFEEQNDLVQFTHNKLLEQEDQGHANIQIVSPYSSEARKQFRGLTSLLPLQLPPEENAISFIKEEVLQEEAGSQRFGGLEIP